MTKAKTNPLSPSDIPAYRLAHTNAAAAEKELVQLMEEADFSEDQARSTLNTYWFFVVALDSDPQQAAVDAFNSAKTAADFFASMREE